MAGSAEGEGAGAVVCAVRTGALASKASVHSTRMLRNFLMMYLWLDQLISAQNQWDSALNEINTARFAVCDRKIFVLFVALFTKSVQSAAGANVNPAIRDCRGCIDLIVELVHREHFPVASGFHH